MRGKIESLELRRLKDGREYLSLDIDGERYSLWDKDYFDKIRLGDFVEYECKQSGRYRNITQIESTGLDYQDESRKRNEQIARMSCLKSASEILANAHMEPVEKAHLALDIARMFEAYIFDYLEQKGNEAE